MIHAYTSATASYIPKARVLGYSLKAHNPEVEFGLILVEEELGPWFRAGDPFDQVTIVPELGIANLKSWAFKHSVVEMSTAVKGVYARQVLDRADIDGILYLDPDIVVAASLSELVAEFESSSVLLTPHLLEPESDPVAVRDNEISCLRHGVFNLGFLGVSADDEGRRFVDWWSQRLQEYCYADLEAGLFTDQKWVDLAPALFRGVKVLRDPGYNVSTWNLNHRRVSGSPESGLLVNDQPLRFYHFSGFDSGAQLRMLMKYGRDMPVLFGLRNRYIRECALHGHNELATVPWSYGQFSNGVPIEQEHRRLYREREDLQSRYPDPFDADDDRQSFLGWYGTFATAS